MEAHMSPVSTVERYLVKLLSTSEIIVSITVRPYFMYLLNVCYAKMPRLK